MNNDSRDDKTIIRNVPSLFALKNTKTGETFPLSIRTTVGRQKGCDIELIDSHISRLHATLEVSGMSLRLRDEGSENGTYVNDKKINETLLEAEDRVKFDEHEFIVISLIQDSAATLIQSHRDTLVMPNPEEDFADTIIMPPEKDADTLLMTSQIPDGSSATLVFKDDRPEHFDTRRKTQDHIIENKKITDRSENVNPDPCVNTEDAICLFGYHPLVFDEIFPLNKTVMIIGKSSKADIVLEDPSVSSMHAELFQENGYWVLQDLESTNGTFLNGQMLSEPRVVMPGDFIQFGLIQLVFGQAEPQSYAPPAANGTKWLVLALIASILLITGVLLITNFAQ